MCSPKSRSFRAFALYLVLRPLLDPFTSDPETLCVLRCSIPWIPRSIYLAALRSDPMFVPVPAKRCSSGSPGQARKRSSWNEFFPGRQHDHQNKRIHGFRMPAVSSWHGGSLSGRPPHDGHPSSAWNSGHHGSTLPHELPLCLTYPVATAS
jgi:hypothetical protein